ncbi:Aldo/keto reductase [Hesseltinella vesiculosa]|uniref:Aldo/keto reductase n=1 Tax=Hesseltinella vesiculosa TaxID=101127 RepID=A0A1X2G594_9FUNG|nr:Aldo/keto reductase [Hesseltinella vesiculosa]
MAPQVPAIKLNSGYDLPRFGFGTFGGLDAPEKVFSAVKVALETGVRSIDTAYVYQTEEAVGRAVKESGVPRNELFITTKLAPPFHEPEHVSKVFDLSLEQLDMDYVDMYLIHWPLPKKFSGYGMSGIKGRSAPRIDVPIIDTWREMEKLVKMGKARSIGVSNFTIPLLEDLLSKATIPPAVNQVELHPHLPQQELVDYCQEKGIALMAYCPLGNPTMSSRFGRPVNLLENEKVLNLAKKYNKTAGQVILNWGIHRGYAVIPKSTTPQRIIENSVMFEMDQEDVDDISSIGVDHPIRA